MKALKDIFTKAKQWVEAKYSLHFNKTSSRSSLTSPYTLSQPDGYIHVFTDGSNSMKEAQLGMGWIIKTDEDEKLLYWDQASRIDGVHVDNQNIAAELLAVIKCLQLLPDNSRVKLHCDLGQIISFVKGEDLWETSTNRALSNYWNDLGQEITRHADIAPIYASDKDNYRGAHSIRCAMRLAHNLAALASGANTQKELLSEDDHTKYGYLFTPSPDKNYGSTDGALDIR